MKMFRNASEALAYMTEVTMATLEGLRDRKSSSKSEIRRHEDMVETGLMACSLYLDPEDARRTRCHRVHEALLTREINRM